MTGIICNYQRKVTPEERVQALGSKECTHCGITERELLLDGQSLEVCGEEHHSDLVTGERVLNAIALCPDCHRAFHLDAKHRHNPCQIKARHSREWLD